MRGQREAGFARCPGYPRLGDTRRKAWMARTSPAMTT